MALQKKNVENATAAVKTAEEELERYIIESTQHEKKLFQKILNQKVKLQKIEDMQQEISLLRDGVVTREESKRDAHSELNIYQNRLQQAQENYQLMLRIEEKFLLLGRIDDETALREAERLSELELEEVQVNPHHIDEWEYHDE